jgi:DNA-binding CsgD family transcriptional regulator
MERLAQRDYNAILEFLEGLYAPVAFGEFPSSLVENLRKLIPCDLATYNEMDPGRHISIDRASPADILTTKAHERWQPVMHEHPVLMHLQRTGDMGVYRISDFYSEREFHARALYHEFYRKISVEDVLCNALQVNGPVVVGCAFARSRRSFTEKDRLTLDLIGPHLTQAWRNARAMSRLRQRMEAADTALEALGCGLVAIRHCGQVTLVTPLARKILCEFFGDGSASDSRLPDMLTRWVHDRKGRFNAGQVPEPLDPLLVSRGESRLTVRLLIDSTQDLLLLQARRPAMERAHLEARGLTRRETEVLIWVAKGKTNHEIGAIVGASPRTVQKHLEHIFAKLGVDTRTAAAAAVNRDDDPL